MPVHGFGYRGNWKEKVTDMRMNVLVAAIVAVSLVRLQAQNVQVRTYAAEGANKTAENPVVVRPIQPLESSAFVGAQPLALSLMPSAEAPDRTLDVALFRLNLLVGAHRRVSIFDLGVIGGISDDEMMGLGISGIFNRTGSSPGAFHLAGVCNHSGRDMNGCQISFVWNWTEGLFNGLQTGLVNRSGRLDGLQVGGFNMAERGTGVQVGIVNMSTRLEGLQIGAFNINRDSAVPVLPVFNFAF